jgi:invasion protein IalB
MPNIRLTPEHRALVLAVLLAGRAGAAEMPPAGEAYGPPPPPPVEAFEDWTLACPEGACTVATRVEGTGGAAVLVLEAGAEALVVRTPLPLLLPEGLGLTLGQADEERTAQWRTCDATGCEARLTMEPDLLAALRRERDGTLRFTLASGERVRIGVSLIGFTAAWRARAARADDAE